MESKENQKNQESNLSFEEHLSNAKEVVRKLESGDCDLDTMISLYNSGIKSLEFCNKKLNDFETKIEIINKDSIKE